jgi:homoserine O-acetyltransferase
MREEVLPPPVKHRPMFPFQLSTDPQCTPLAGLHRPTVHTLRILPLQPVVPVACACRVIKSRTMKRHLLFLLMFAVVLPPLPVRAQEQQFAQLGDFKLESGEILRDCRIGYRTLGTLNAEASNIILVPTWAGGTTGEWLGSAGPGKLADTSKYYVILVDALANGVSSSPSNSAAQPHMHFPKITIADMVNTQHELLVRVLHLRHVKAVMGISMGGMQTFQWLASYPDFMDMAVPIVGSPRLAPYDLLHWQAEIDAIENDPGWKGGDYTRNPDRGTEYEFGSILLTTPQHYNETTQREEVLQKIAEERKSITGQDANNTIRQTEAMMALDITAAYGGSMEKGAAAVKAKLLVVASRYDHVVTPGPALEFARLAHAHTLELDSDCGHLASSCEGEKVRQAVAAFLEQ